MHHRTYPYAMCKCFKRSFSNAAFQLATSHNGKEIAAGGIDEIKIPMRIHRGPTDVLKALASTVGHDDTALPYKYMDDPFFLPSDSHRRRQFALSKESGRKTAQYLATKYAPLFKYEPDEPRIAKFRPALKPTDVSSDQSLTESDLLEFVTQGWTLEATKLYEKIASECSTETKLRFLEYLSFYNCQEPLENDYFEQNFYRVYFKSDQVLNSVWKTDGLAMEIFRTLQPKPQRAYAALITGMAKYSCADEAFEMLDELKSSQRVTIRDPCFYEQLMDCSVNLNLSPTHSWALVVDLLKMGAKAGLKPRATTFNSMLYVISRIPRMNAPEETSLEVLREMRAVNVEPSPATYFFLLNIHRNKPGRLLSLLEFTLDSIEKKALSFVDQRDSLFFPYCAQVISQVCREKSPAYRLHAALKYASNGALLNDFFAENDYYSALTRFLSRVEEPVAFMDFFESVFIVSYNPMTNDFKEILHNVAVNNGNKHIVRLYPAMMANGLLRNAQLTQEFVQVLLEAYDADFDTKRQFGDIAYDMKNKIEKFNSVFSRHATRSPLEVTNRMIFGMAKLCENAGQIERSKEIAAMKPISRQK